MSKILMEGGNVWDDVTPFDHLHIPDILKTINGALKGTGIKALPVGSAATPTPGKISGDMDVIADEASVLDFFNVPDAKTGRKSLAEYLNNKGFEVSQSGINVHVKVPVGTAFHQVDIMVTPNAKKVAAFHTHAIPKGSPYKGVNKQLIMAMIAKERNLMWSAWQGLFNRDAKGKKGEFITDDMDKIAKMLLGASATAKDLGSVESILAALPKDTAKALLDRASQDPNWAVVKEQAVKKVKESIDQPGAGVDKVTMDVPLLIRIMEYSKEDAKTDMDLHRVAERLVELAQGGETLSMEQYDSIVGTPEKTDESMWGVPVKVEKGQYVDHPLLINGGVVIRFDGSTAYVKDDKEKVYKFNATSLRPRRQGYVSETGAVEKKYWYTTVEYGPTGNDIHHLKIGAPDKKTAHKKASAWARNHGVQHPMISVWDEMTGDKPGAHEVNEGPKLDRLARKFVPGADRNLEEGGGKAKHPFEGGVKATTITKRHRPLIWENMLGTVYAREFSDTYSRKPPKYFDYDWDAARQYAGVDKCTDLRIVRNKQKYQNWPDAGKMVLWGIPQVGAAASTPGDAPVQEEKQRLDPKCWKGYRKVGTKVKDGVRVNNCVPVKEDEGGATAPREYHGKPTNHFQSDAYYIVDSHTGEVEAGPYKDVASVRRDLSGHTSAMSGAALNARGAKPRARGATNEQYVGIDEDRDNPLRAIDPNKWHLIRGDIPVIINLPDEYTATQVHSGHGYGRETKVLPGARVRQNAYLKHNPNVVDWVTYSSNNESEMLEETLLGNSFHEKYGWIRYEPENLMEAEYQGRKVQLNKPMKGDVAKFRVYVKDPKTGRVKKVNFGDPNMTIKKHIPGRRKSFRARHNCDTAKDKTTARYWSCRKW